MATKVNPGITARDSTYEVLEGYWARSDSMHMESSSGVELE
jgi:hypothetical protein